MLYFTHKIFNEEKVKDLRKRLMLDESWTDGSMTATGKVKRNIEISTGSSYQNFSKEVINTLLSDKIINSYTFPANIHNILFTRTGQGMFYGPHVDTPFLDNGRRDLSFTIFLNSPEDYEGGELILFTNPEVKTIKMLPGYMIIYPTKYLHEVKPVNKGERMVCVGWIESQIPRDDDRETLYTLKKGMDEIIEKYGQSSATQKIIIAHNNIYKRFILN